MTGVQTCALPILGRGAVADPFLARDIRAGLIREAADPRDADWAELLPAIAFFWARVRGKLAARHAPGRLKQWLVFLSRRFDQADALCQALRALNDIHAIDAVLAAAGADSLARAA